MTMTLTTSKIGILGGTFDPIHKGHIGPAKQALQQFYLNKILVIPAHKPPHKNTTTASTAHRVKMAELVCNNENAFELDTREINRSTLSYTVDTLKEIKTEQPNSELFFIMGMDSLLSFTKWHRWQDILLHCHLIVNTRPGYNLNNINDETQQLLAQHQMSIATYQQNASTHATNKAGYIFLHPVDELDISSTHIRSQFKPQLSPKSDNLPYLTQELTPYLTPEVLQYITMHKLYSIT